jgi:hypothetical protein
VSTLPPLAEREGPAEGIAGFLAALAIFGGAIAVAQRPVTIGIASLVVALVSAAMAGGRNQRLASAAVAITGSAWLIGMVVSVLTNRPLW